MEGYFSKDYVKSIRNSNDYKENEIASNDFIVRNLINCMEYGKKWSSDPFHAWSRQFEYPWVATQIKNLVNKTVRVMDAGSGYTYFPYYLLSKVLPENSTIDAIDYDPWLQQFFGNTVHSHAKELNYQIGNLATLSIKNQYDIIYSVSTLEHSAHELPKMLDNLYNALVDGGYLILTMDISPDGSCDIDINLFRIIWSVFREKMSIISTHCDLINYLTDSDNVFTLADALNDYAAVERWMNDFYKKLRIFGVVLQKI